MRVGDAYPTLAAGTKLGPLVGLNGGVNAQAAPVAYGGYNYQPQQYLQRLMGVQDDDESEEETEEVSALTPEALRFTAQVTASFALQRADK